jgi:putative transposase
LPNVEDLIAECGIDICHEMVRHWQNRFGPMLTGDIRWHLDEMYVKLNGKMVYLWRAVDHEDDILESYITKTRDKEAALQKRRSVALARWQSLAARPLLKAQLASCGAEFALD